MVKIEYYKRGTKVYCFRKNSLVECEVAEIKIDLSKGDPVVGYSLITNAQIDNSFNLQSELVYDDKEKLKEDILKTFE